MRSALSGSFPRKSGCEEATGGVDAYPAFWRGMIDGDGTLAMEGSVGGGEQRTGLGNGRRYFSPYLRLCGSRRICEQFTTFAQQALGDPFAPTISPMLSIFQVCFWGEHAIRLIDILYADADPECALDRKLLTARGLLDRFAHFRDLPELTLPETAL